MSSTPDMRETRDHAGQWNNMNINMLFNFIRQDEAVLKYQDQLESEIRQSRATYLQLINHCTDLEGKLCEVEHMRSRLELKVEHITEDNKALHRTLELERTKIREMASRLASLSSINQSLLSGDSKSMGSDTRSVDTRQLLLENEQQRILISNLHSTLDCKNETIKNLRQALSEVNQGVKGAIEIIEEGSESQIDYWGQIEEV
ncbi:hypothetical protein BO94DRAFT_601198 [Aspergillus sclerotioniger CBS 115572]|uniref:Uncharacterized protein n=1 Tax=Aspergillus sclerotioniger CBS 115572 TaxID=1450535 RepID=A0A317XD19_9EURO|nr:hypothetical protein BO94DRAFT_601198 [Aspergillus sclerotioniger CBS 115572]PWY96031.1 hypothetical protein BO94DRAFT_601198 [Aspergillus sclerotioniger CBS 115572]